MKTKHRTPSGRSFDIINKVSRCLVHAAAITGAVVGPDIWFYFDNPSGGVKKIHEIVLIVLVSSEMAEKFLNCLDDQLLEEYSLDYDVEATLSMETKMLGVPYSLHNESRPSVWRTYVLWRTEGDVPKSVMKVK